MQFAASTVVEKARSNKANQQIEVLKTDIEKYIANAETKLTQEISEHEEDIFIWNGDAQAATTVLEVEKSDDATHKDYSESVNALERIIAVLKKQTHDRSRHLWCSSNRFVGLFVRVRRFRILFAPIRLSLSGSSSFARDDIWINSRKASQNY